MVAADHEVTTTPLGQGFLTWQPHGILLRELKRWHLAMAEKRRQYWLIQVDLQINKALATNAIGPFGKFLEIFCAPLNDPVELSV